MIEATFDYSFAMVGGLASSLGDLCVAFKILKHYSVKTGFR